MTRRFGGKRIEAAKLILAALILGLSGLLQRQSLAQPAEGLEAQVQDAIADLKDQDPEVRRSAAETLENIARGAQAALDPAILPPLIEALADEGANVRGRAAEALAWSARKFRDQPALAPGIPPLTEALQDESAAVRRSAARALGRMAPNVQDGAALVPAIPPLIEALQDEDADVREQAWVALSRIAPLVGEAVAERVLAAFTKVLHGEDTTTSIRAAGELARILSHIIIREPDAINPDDLCRAYVYLGYMADGQGNRDEAASWYKKVRETRGRTDVAELLLAHGADANARSTSRSIALHWAASEGHRDVVRLLLDAGADVRAGNENGWTPLHAAARAGHQHVARLLLDAGADLRAEKEDGWTPLHEAASAGHNDLVAMLLTRAADSSGDKPEPPVAVIQAEPTSGNVPLNVRFDGSTDPSHSIVLHRWTFGDGEGAVGPRVAHFYPPEGAFQAELTVTDYTGQTDTATIAISGTTRPDKIAVVVDTDLTPILFS